MTPTRSQTLARAQQAAYGPRKLSYPAAVAAAPGDDQDDHVAITAVLRLAHDVGKHVARTAHNAHGPLSPALHAMLLKDLYALAPGVRASQLFEQRAPSAASASTRAVLEECRDRLREIDALEPAVRAAQAGAISRACALALSIEQALRALARALSSPGSSSRSGSSA